jgi:hypothetical protein
MLQLKVTNKVDDPSDSCDNYTVNSKEEDKDSDDDAPLSLSWSSSTHATLARDVRLAIERACVSSPHFSTTFCITNNLLWDSYSVMLSVEDAILSEETIADGWVEGLHANPPFGNLHCDSCCAGRCERMLDMIGMERLHDSQLIGRCVTSDLTEVHFRNPKSPTTEAHLSAAHGIPTR